MAGEIGCGGVSSVDQTGNATEVFRVQLALRSSAAAQALLLMLRLLVLPVQKYRAVIL
jgi:hypothetical protein